MKISVEKAIALLKRLIESGIYAKIVFNIGNKQIANIHKDELLVSEEEIDKQMNLYK